jgi:hypothetical protein
MALLGAGLVAAGCGTAPAPASGHPAGSGARQYRTLCTATGAVSRVVVTRIPSLSALSAQRPQPVTVTVSNPARARELATALCRLPALPVGVYQCPLNVLGGYALSFTLAQRRFPLLTVESGGCQAVRGLGRARWAARAPGFWRTLSRATGIAGPLHGR